MRILDRIGTSSYRLELPEQWKKNKIHDVFHEGLLTPYKVTKQYRPLFEEPLPDVIEGEEEYEVDVILDVQQTG